LLFLDKNWFPLAAPFAGLPQLLASKHQLQHGNSFQARAAVNHVAEASSKSRFIHSLSDFGLASTSQQQQQRIAIQRRRHSLHFHDRLLLLQTLTARRLLKLCATNC